MIELLIQFGANLDSITPSGFCALHLSILEKNFNVSKLLINSGCNIELRDSGSQETPFLLSCSLIGCTE